MSAEIYLTVFTTVTALVSIVSFLAARSAISKEISSRVKLDVTLDQMREHEQKVKIFLDEHNISAGTDIHVIAQTLNVTKGGEEPGLKSLAHLSDPDENGRMVVTFQPGLSPEATLFALAHECAHLVNKDSTPADRPHGYNKPQIEQLADYTAAALLMPLDAVYTFLTQGSYKRQSPRKRMVMVRQLCKTYGVDEIIVLRRIQEVYDLKGF